GRKCGQRWLPIYDSWEVRPDFVTAIGVPPSTGTRKIGLPRSGAKIMVPEFPQLPPRASSASHTICTGPPSTATRFNLPSAKKPISRPSGDQKGAYPLEVPAISRASAERRDRTQIEHALLPAMDIDADSLLHPVNARLLPSGEICGG